MIGGEGGAESDNIGNDVWRGDQWQVGDGIETETLCQQKTWARSRTLWESL